MAEVNATELRSEIVCPLTLKIAIASEGRLGAIQSYRCQPKSGNKWETRPQKDKWASDFFKVLNAGKDETVLLSDGKTRMRGIDQPSETRFLFSHDDGKLARRVAIKQVKEGKLRAPRNWDRNFADEAEVDLEELKATYPELYDRVSSPRNNEVDEEVETLGEGFFGEDDMGDIEGRPAVAPVPLDEEDEALIAEEEEAYEEGEPAYSVATELGFEEAVFEERQQTRGSNRTKKEIKISQPPIAATLHVDALAFRADMGGEYVTFYKVRNPETGNFNWMCEGDQECVHNYHLTVNKRQAA